MLMGDLVVTETELAHVTDALQAHGIEQTALHKHLLEHTPPVWWTHMHAMADNPAELARGVKAALEATAIPPATPPGPQPQVDLDTAGIDQALGRKGTADGGIYKVTIARKDTIVDDGHVLPPTFGVTTGINFQPVGGGKAAINGDFVMTGPEVQKVIQALRKGNIDLVEIHNHSFTEQPRLFYSHFWAVDDWHVALDIQCLDRIYLNAYIPILQSSAQVVAFLSHHLGFPFPSPALFKQLGDRFRRAVTSFAQANDIPWVRFGKDQVAASSS